VAEVEVIDAANAFGFNLLRELAADDPEQNLFISPLSASMALGMTLNGAAGNTYDGMLEALALQGLGQEEINLTYDSLIELLDGLDPAVTFQLANSVWAREGFPVLPDFLQRVQDHFDATAESVDFSDPATLDRVNDWVKEGTGGKIEKMFDSFPGNLVMILLNAIYFKGDWTDAFDRDRTQDGVFTLADGSTKTAKLMHRRADLLYLDDADFQAVELPYGGGAYAMTVVLPRHGVRLAEVVAELDAPTWSAWTDALAEQDLTLDLPRFTVEWEEKLNEVLIRLGMEDAFDPGRADFTRLTARGGIWVDEVKQKTFVEVNEEGTEAAAATSVSMVDSAPPGVRVDRPFLVAIRERLSGTILFLGAIYDPESE
jgi:serpin B